MMVSAVEHPVGHSLCRRFQPAKLAFFFKKSGPQPAGCEKTTNFLTEIKENYPHCDRMIYRIAKKVIKRLCLLFFFRKM